MKKKIVAGTLLGSITFAGLLSLGATQAFATQTPVVEDVTVTVTDGDSFAPVETFAEDQYEYDYQPIPEGTPISKEDYENKVNEQLLSAPLNYNARISLTDFLRVMSFNPNNSLSFNFGESRILSYEIAEASSKDEAGNENTSTTILQNVDDKLFAEITVNNGDIQNPTIVELDKEGFELRLN